MDVDRSQRMGWSSIIRGEVFGLEWAELWNGPKKKWVGLVLAWIGFRYWIIKTKDPFG